MLQCGQLVPGEQRAVTHQRGRSSGLSLHGIEHRVLDVDQEVRRPYRERDVEQVVDFRASRDQTRGGAESWPELVQRVDPVLGQAAMLPVPFVGQVQQTSDQDTLRIEVLREVLLARVPRSVAVEIDERAVWIAERDRVFRHRICQRLGLRVRSSGAPTMKVETREICARTGDVVYRRPGPRPGQPGRELNLHRDLQRHEAGLERIVRYCEHDIASRDSWSSHDVRVICPLAQRRVPTIWHDCGIFWRKHEQHWLALPRD